MYIYSVNFCFTSGNTYHYSLALLASRITAITADSVVLCLILAETYTIYQNSRGMRGPMLFKIIAQEGTSSDLQCRLDVLIHDAV